MKYLFLISILSKILNPLGTAKVGPSNIWFNSWSLIWITLSGLLNYKKKKKKKKKRKKKFFTVK